MFQWMTCKNWAKAMLASMRKNLASPHPIPVATTQPWQGSKYNQVVRRWPKDEQKASQTLRMSDEDIGLCNG
jgi:hypothetical protein